MVFNAARICLLVVFGVFAVPACAQATDDARYAESFRDLYETIGERYPCFALKRIDWEAVGEEMLPRAASVTDDESFGLLCLELIARLQDSHAQLLAHHAPLPQIPFPRWDPGFSCLVDDRGAPVVFHVDRTGPARSAGVTPGMTVVEVNGVPAGDAINDVMSEVRRYVGFSSERYLRYQAVRWFTRAEMHDAPVRLVLENVDGTQVGIVIRASLDSRYVPRLPVPIESINDSANVDHRMLDGGIGYIYVRRIRADLIERLDAAIGDLAEAKGLIVDVRGNSGGGFDSQRSHVNFSMEPVATEPRRPRFAGPIALLTDARCISAGEGWASWFVANDRAKVFGETTAGASSRKIQYTLLNERFRVRLPVKAYTGFLDRPIERRGLEPDVPIMPNARDLAAGRDTVLEAARAYLLDAPSN